ncbi:hypothetical protein DMH18_40505 [Streptomyces sp. WAC 06783]|nr:hypothetical protein DMH18_40505 [Streptomyces sp. WAC 06783]
MMDDRLMASRVRRGDQVRLRGRLQEVKAIRPDRASSRRPTVVLVFKGHPSERFTADTWLWGRDRKRSR